MSTKYMDINEFMTEGFLQEANRQFFHPLGLALEITIEDDTNEARISGVWDYRDDPEGILFADGVLTQDKETNVHSLKESKVEARDKNIDCWGGIQSVEANNV